MILRYWNKIKKAQKDIPLDPEKRRAAEFHFIQKAKRTMEFIALPKTELAQIKPLWEMLNQTHFENSNNWKEHFSKQTFEERFDKLQKEENVLLLISKVEKDIIAYCFSTANGVSGEIASIYATEPYRKQNIDKGLIMQSVEWFKKNNINKIIVGVAEGNEVTLPFYEELGFKKSATVLKFSNK